MLPQWFKRGSALFMHWVADDFFWSREDIDTPAGLLKFWDAFGGRVLEAGFFLGIAWSVWNGFSCPASPFVAWLACLLRAALPCTLVMMVGTVYFLSRRSAAVEIAIADRLFPRGRMPEHWIGRRDAIGITVSVVAFFLLYVALAWLSDRILLASLAMLAIACIDFNTRRLIGKRIRDYFRDSRYMPTEDDEEKTAIEESRQVVHRFLYGKPHLEKEGLRVAGCAVAFVLAGVGYWYGKEWATVASYLCLMFTLLVNEIITWKWRSERDRSLLAIKRRW